MKIKYEFVNGDVVEIEVDQEIGNVILELDRKEKCNNHTETRRHSRLDTKDDKSRWQIDNHPEEDEETFMRCGGRTFRHGDRRLQDAFAKLTARQRSLAVEHIIRGVSIEEYAREKGLTERAVWGLKKRTLEKMKNNL